MPKPGSTGQSWPMMTSDFPCHVISCHNNRGKNMPLEIFISYLSLCFKTFCSIFALKFREYTGNELDFS